MEVKKYGVKYINNESVGTKVKRDIYPHLKSMNNVLISFKMAG